MYKKTYLKAAILLVAAIVIPFRSLAKDGFSVHGKADFVSDYVWRGAYQSSGVSVQPSLTLGYAGISLNVWGNQSVTKEAKEFDINLGYSINNFSVMVSDYWWSGVDRSYGDYKNDHFFEVSLGYCFGEKFPLTLTWGTMFAGGDKNEEGDLQGSTYITASYPISLPLEITLTPAVGFTPWKGMYHDKAAFTDLSLKASKDIKITESFNIPIFLQVIAAPVYDRTYLIAGISIGF